MGENMEKQGFKLPAVVSLQPEQINEACQVLAKAFYNIPVIEWIFPNINHRNRVLPWYLGMWVRDCLRYGKVLTTPALEGVGGWVNPENINFSRRRLIEQGWLYAPLRLGLSSFRRAYKFKEYLGGQTNRHEPPPPYLPGTFIGVDPSCQRIGVAKALFVPYLELADREGLPCYFQTLLEKNLAIFSKFGFEVVHKRGIPRTEISIWAMIRWPKNS
jgi:GNAT superfamily N-acetyltransferase